MISVSDANPSYATYPHSRTHSPPSHRPYDEYRDCLRQEFAFRCVYCLSIEREVGPSDNYGGFEVEHFRPKGRRDFRRFERQYANLFWSCHACNRAKGHKWPTDEELALGFRYIDPCTESLADHVELRGEEVVALNGSPAGEYTIDEINLNSDLQRERRRRRMKIAKVIASAEALRDVLREQVTASPEKSTPELLALLREADDQLVDLLALHLGDPWDAPGSCLCSATTTPAKRRRLTRRQRKTLRQKSA